MDTLEKKALHADHNQEIDQEHCNLCGNFGTENVDDVFYTHPEISQESTLPDFAYGSLGGYVKEKRSEPELKIEPTSEENLDQQIQTIDRPPEVQEKRPEPELKIKPTSEENLEQQIQTANKALGVLDRPQHNAEMTSENIALDPSRYEVEMTNEDIDRILDFGKNQAARQQKIRDRRKKRLEALRRQRKESLSQETKPIKIEIATEAEEMDSQAQMEEYWNKIVPQPRPVRQEIPTRPSTMSEISEQAQIGQSISLEDASERKQKPIAAEKIPERSNSATDIDFSPNRPVIELTRRRFV